MDIDRVALNKALARAIAHKQCGNNDQAQQWAQHLVELLRAAKILG